MNDCVIIRDNWQLVVDIFDDFRFFTQGVKQITPFELTELANCVPMVFVLVQQKYL